MTWARCLHPLVLLLTLSCAASTACGQGAAPARVSEAAPPPIARELRAVWVATVENMDWPSRKGLSTAAQQQELVAMLDKLVELRMNAIVFQVRPAADALYQSSIEPWSDVLTGQMGRAPSPYYDPLAFAIDEAHKRGIEFHAWINPYRAKHPSTHGVAPDHVSRTHPELVRTYGPYLWLDPGDPAVRALSERVVFDLVRRYDIDALHMDDYFYPYPEVRHHREIPFPDDATWQRYRREGGTLSRDDWRRENVNLLVKELHEGVHAIKPWVRFGISPFGIWRPGHPASVRGLDQFSVLYADARKWLREGWVDYLTPQLYWSVNKPQQRYDELLRWWVEQNTHGRHIWPGNYTGKVAFTGSAAWRTSEVMEQIRLTRAQPGATGNVHFSMSVFMQDPDSLNETLMRGAYAQPALVPASPWLASDSLATPNIVVRTDPATGSRKLELRPGARPGSPARAPWLWAVQTRTTMGWRTEIVPGTTRTLALPARDDSSTLDVRVTSVGQTGVTSVPVRLVSP